MSATTMKDRSWNSYRHLWPQIEPVLGHTKAKLSASIRPGQSVMYHAWEDYQFEDGRGCRTLQASPLKPLELVGDMPYMERKFMELQPGMSDRDTRVDYRKA